MIGFETSLHSDIKKSVFLFLDIKSLISVQQVCTEWNELINTTSSRFIWENISRKLLTQNGGSLITTEKAARLIQNEWGTREWKQFAKNLYLTLHRRPIKATTLASRANATTTTTTTKTARMEEDDNDDNEDGRSDEENDGDGDGDDNEDKDAPRSIIERAVRASSTDTYTQSIQETRRVASFYGRTSFWSSKGSDDEHSSEYGIYLLKQAPNEQDGRQHGHHIHVTFIDNLKLRPFSASWQNYNIYAPKTCSVSFGLGSGDDDFTLFTTREFPVQKSAEYQVFSIGPIVVLTTDDEDMKPYDADPKLQRKMQLQAQQKQKRQRTSGGSSSNNNANDADADADDSDDDDIELDDLLSEDPISERIRLSNFLNNLDTNLVRTIYRQVLSEHTEQRRRQRRGASSANNNGRRDDRGSDNEENNGEDETEDDAEDDDAFDPNTRALSIIIGIYHESREREREILRREKHGQVPPRGSVFVRVNYHGRTEKQPTDDLYYTCIENLDILGTCFWQEV